jgi:hypothetical protein
VGEPSIPRTVSYTGYEPIVIQGLEQGSFGAGKSMAFLLSVGRYVEAENRATLPLETPRDVLQEWRDQVSLQIESLRDLPIGWDTYDAERITDQAICVAKHVTSEIISRVGRYMGSKAKPFDVAPLADGGLDVEWRGMDARVEIDFGPDGEIGFLLKRREGDAWRYEEDDDIDIDRATHLVIRTILQ